MRIIVYDHILDHADPRLDDFAEGLRRHGIDPIRRKVKEGPVDADLAVFWGHRRWPIIQHQRAAGRPYLVLERGFLGDRMEWTSAGYNGLNGRASFVTEDVPADRFCRYWQHELKPLRNDGDVALLVGQVAGDAATEHTDLPSWYLWAAGEMRRQYALPVVFRPHPGSQHTAVRGLESSRLSEHDDIDRAAVVVTFNSNFGVLAAMAGKAVVALDEGSMAYPVAAHRIGEVVRVDRRLWASRLAYCQWQEHELRDGTAWEHLHRGMPGV